MPSTREPSMFNPADWSGAISKIFSDIKDDDPVTQTDLRIVGGLGLVGGMAVQGARANNRIKTAEASGEKVKPFKYFLV